MPRSVWRWPRVHHRALALCKLQIAECRCTGAHSWLAPGFAVSTSSLQPSSSSCTLGPWISSRQPSSMRADALRAPSREAALSARGAWPRAVSARHCRRECSGPSAVRVQGDWRAHSLRVRPRIPKGGRGAPSGHEGTRSRELVGVSRAAHGRSRDASVAEPSRRATIAVLALKLDLSLLRSSVRGSTPGSRGPQELSLDPSRRKGPLPGLASTSQSEPSAGARGRMPDNDAGPTPTMAANVTHGLKPSLRRTRPCPGTADAAGFGACSI